MGKGKTKHTTKEDKLNEQIKEGIFFFSQKKRG
jgi:hypothetical protein